MQNTTSTKVLKASSIINIIGGIAGTLFGVLTIVGGALVGSAKLAESPELMKSLAQAGIPADSAGFGLGMIGVMLLLGGVFSIVLGGLGVKGARDHGAIKPAWTLSLIALVLSVAGVVSAVFAGNLGGSLILSVILSGAMFWAANDIKEGTAVRASLA